MASDVGCNHWIDIGQGWIGEDKLDREDKHDRSDKQEN